MTSQRLLGRAAVFVALGAASAIGCARCAKTERSPASPVAPAPPDPSVDRGFPARPPDHADDRTSVSGMTYRVGPRRRYAKIGEVAARLQPGDVVLVDGDATYVEDLKLREAGTAARKITLRGVRVNGKRPVLQGTASAVELAGDHYVFEGFEVTGGSARCLYHHAGDVTVRDVAVHDCPSHGILSADEGSGSLTLDYVEVYNAGSGEMKHPVYVTTDEEAHPGAVFRMQHCYVHDGHGGNAVKSRAERNEIYYNWIEGASYDELGLYGPDGEDESAVPPNARRRDSDVVGNVIRKTGDRGYVARLGGDGSGQSWGRYRFVNNTLLLSPGAAGGFRITFGIDSLELYNNVFHRAGGGGIVLVKDLGTWKGGHPLITASNNLVPPGSRWPGGVPWRPSDWMATVVSDDPGFVDVASHDVRPLAWSPLVRAGNVHPASPADHPFPSPLAAPLYLPPPRAIEAPGTARPRACAGTIAIGAFER